MALRNLFRFFHVFVVMSGDIDEMNVFIAAKGLQTSVIDQKQKRRYHDKGV